MENKANTYKPPPTEAIQPKSSAQSFLDDLFETPNQVEGPVVPSFLLDLDQSTLIQVLNLMIPKLTNNGVSIAYFRQFVGLPVDKAFPPSLTYSRVMTRWQQSFRNSFKPSPGEDPDYHQRDLQLTQWLQESLLEVLKRGSSELLERSDTRRQLLDAYRGRLEGDGEDAPLDTNHDALPKFWMEDAVSVSVLREAS